MVRGKGDILLEFLLLICFGGVVMLKCKLGICSVSFRKYSPEEIAKAVSDAGLECIEWGSDIHAPCMDAEAIENIVSIQKKYGISCSSYGTYFHLGSDDFDELPHYIRAANMLGTNVLRLWCGAKRTTMTFHTQNYTF